MRLLVGFARATLVALLASSCFSRIDPRLRPELLARIEAVRAPHLRAHLACEPTPSSPLQGEETLAKVRELLSASPWFDTLEAAEDEADLLLVVRFVEAPPFCANGMLGPALLSSVLPLPFDERHGLLLSATRRDSGATVEVDTRREVSGVAWTLAPLFNLFPDRCFVVSDARELARVHAQLLPLLEQQP